MGAVVALSGVLVFVGWAFDIVALKSVLPDWPEIVASAGLGFILCGLGLTVSARALPAAQAGATPLANWLGPSLCAGATLIGILRLTELVFGVNLGIDTFLLGAEASIAGSATSHMWPATAVNFVLLGTALLLPKSGRSSLLFHVLVLTALLTAWVSLGRYLYGGEPLLAYATMAAPTAFLFFLLSVGALAVRRDIGLMALLRSDTEGGSLARRLLVPALIAPLVIGWLRLRGQQAGWYGTEAGVLLFAVSDVMLFGALVWINASLLRRTDLERQHAERKTGAQLERLNLLQHITRAIGERQDLGSIFQVAIRSVEEELPVDFCCVLLRDVADGSLTVTAVGVKSAKLAMELALPERTRIAIDANGLSRCVGGQLVYEPDIAAVQFPFPQRLANGGQRALVIAPLAVESHVFGVLVATRRESHSFSSGECDFLRQLSEHVALAAHQAQLYGSLQQAYDDLRQTQQIVTQQERLKALGQMASGIAHDINNAVSPVALYTQSLLENEPGLSQRARNYLETIQRAIEDVAHTVARMREFYRHREPQLTLSPVNANLLIPQILDLTRARWSNMAQQQGIVIEVETQLGPDVPPVMGSESELREALINLVFNAVDSMPQGGKLKLATSVIGGAPTGAGEVAGSQVQIEVIDSGVGMDAATRARCLEPFFTTKGERGTGLGLAMVYGAVERHSGDIDIESEVGSGTTVRLRFPVATAIIGATSDETDAAVRPRLRILIVDDDPVLLKSLCDTLEIDGHVVSAAGGGQAGIDAFRGAHARGPQFDVVITDLGMPHVDGRVVANAIKATSRLTPVILLTGWGQRLLDDGESPAHVDRVLSKPPKLREIRRALAQLKRQEA